MYLGRSKHHAADVSLILHLKTGHTSSQYHMFFDDDFRTVNAATENDEVDIWKDLPKTNPTSGIINQFREEDKFSFDDPQLDVMELNPLGIATIIESQQPSTNDWIPERNKKLIDLEDGLVKKIGKQMFR